MDFDKLIGDAFWKTAKPTEDQAEHNDMQSAQETEDNNDPYYVAPQDVFQAASDSIDAFNQKAYTIGSGYEAPNFPMWSEKLEGLTDGFYIITGFSNSGKSAYAMNLCYDYAMHESNHLYGIYYTLDDDKQSLISRVLAMMQNIPISVAAKPLRWQEKIDNGEDADGHIKEWLRLREEGIQKLKDNSSHILVVDSNDINCIEKLLNHAKMVKRYVQTRDENANVIVFIDSLMDIHIDSEHYREEKDKNARISQLIKRFSEVDLQCPIFGTAHIRKNTAKKAKISDLKESGRYEYDAKAVFIVHNDVSRNGQAAEVFYSTPNDSTKHPILEIQWSKNKASSFKERTYCAFFPDQSRAVECDAEQTQYYNNIVYGIGGIE